MPRLTSDLLDRAFGLLGELLMSEKRPPQHYVVCGGSSLLALRLVNRTTQDVDILARVERESLVSPRSLPNWLHRAADAVAQQLDLPANWLNAQVAEDTLFSCGLPEGL